MLRALLLAAALVGTIACGGVSSRGLIAARGLDGAAEELQRRLLDDPRDPDLLIALAEVEDARGRPGAALAALDRADRLGRPFRDGLAAAPRARFAILLALRGVQRAGRGSPGAETDLRHAQALGAAIHPADTRLAALATIAADLRHSDPDRRQRGRARLVADHPTLAAGLDPAATAVDVERTTAWLVAVGARRVAFETLDRIAERAAATGTLATGTLPPWAAPTVERWLTLRRWWSGTADPIDRITLDRAAALGASTCAYARWPAYPDCTPDPDGIRPAIDPATGAVVEDARAPAPIAAAGSAAASDPIDPSWSALAARAAAAPADPAALTEAHAALTAAHAALIDRLADIADGFRIDPALADRRAEDLAATSIDAAVVAPAIARLFATLGDPARARRWWQRGFDASPEEPALALGLAIAMAEAADPPAGLQLVTRAAAASGDAPATFLRAARGFAAAGQTLDALSLARAAIEQSAPGDEDPAAGLAAALLRDLGRATNAAQLAALAEDPTRWDLRGVRDHIAQLAVAAGRDPAGPDRARAVEALLTLAGSDDPAAAHLAAAALRAIAGKTAAPGPAAGLR